ncbi:adenylate/guanylate cyclase domain-containing protein [Ruegeria sp. HKCCA0235A]|uniref:adenylate/guanylate cyclase domain-containing protein n=1 Tax=Ruegeria sp. HKCCA0235A TaxID=2682998 RepID=UPI00148A106C|nr:adenylate/guanylate cyclase domain-containing protein [Ruegeria sp. HKCCA0235A]
MAHRLTAILIADVVGYSRMLTSDEAAALRMVREIESGILKPAVWTNSGKIIKTVGDGWITEFGSAIGAVDCALEVQQLLAFEHAAELRIGVDIGDVVPIDHEVFGTAVNVATRLQEFADPAGIAISDATYATLDETVARIFVDAGIQELKNLARPLRVWTAAPFSVREIRQMTSGAEAWSKDLFLELAPICTTDPRDEIHEIAHALDCDLRALLSASGWLRIGRELTDPDGAYRLEGVLRSVQNRLRLEVRLLLADGEVWTAKYEGDLPARFEWQDEVSEELSTTVLGVMLDERSAELRRRISELRVPDLASDEKCVDFLSVTQRTVNADCTAIKPPVAK